MIAIGSQTGPIKAHHDGTLIEVRVKPGSSRCKVERITSGVIAISVHAPPTEGKANRETLKILAETLGVPASRLEIVKGHSSRQKTIFIRGISMDETRAKLFHYST